MLSIVWNQLIMLLLLAGVVAQLPHAALAAGIMTQAKETYLLKLDNKVCGALKEVSGGGAHTDILSQLQGSGYSTKLPGKLFYDPFTIKVGFDLNNELARWITDSWNFTTPLPFSKSGALLTTDVNQTVTEERQFTKAFIIETTIPECNLLSKEDSCLEVKFAPELSKDIPPEKLLTIPAEASKQQATWQPSFYKLEIDRIDCKNVEKIDSFTIKRALAYLNTGVVAPQAPTFPNLHLTLPERDAPAWQQWFDDFVVKGGNSQDHREGRLIFYEDIALKHELARIELHKIGICGIDPGLRSSTTNQIRKFTADIYCESMSFIVSGIPSTVTMGTADEIGNPPVPDGKLGTLYTIRNEHPLLINMEKLGYTTAQVVMGDRYYVPTGEEKMMMLHFSIKNPNNENVNVRWDSLKFIAIDAAENNYEGAGDWGNALDSKIIDTEMLPGQKLECIAVIKLKAKGPAVKLLVIPPDNSPTLGFPLLDDKGAVNPVNPVTALSAPIADPKDKTGTTALTIVPGQFNAAYPYKLFEVTVEKCEYSTATLERAPLRSGDSYLVYTLLIKNKVSRDANIRFDTFNAILSGLEGEEFPLGGELLAPTSNRKIDVVVKPGVETRVRMYFKVAKGTTPKVLTLQEDDSRSYTFTVPGRPLGRIG